MSGSHNLKCYSNSLVLVQLVAKQFFFFFILAATFSFIFYFWPAGGFPDSIKKSFILPNDTAKV
jgi:hypothetical protein